MQPPTLHPSNVVYDSLRLAISAPKLDCAEVAEHLAACGILANTTSNLTSVRGGIEEGCGVTIHRVTKPVLQSAVWQPLKDRFGLTCAHVLVPGVFTGCVLDFLRPSLCSSTAAAKA